MTVFPSLGTRMRPDSEPDTASRVLANRYRLERLLGRGGAGEVHAALDLLTGHRVALKLLRAQNGDPGLEESLRSEFRLLRGLSHPGIVRVFDFGRPDGHAAFYTMELLEGCDLGTTRETVPPNLLLEQVARALDYLHARGLVHSDLKPSNVFRIGSPPRFKLTDFGLARRAQQDRHEGPYGTLAYMPPERMHAQDTKPDPREDLYALGALLFECLTGRPPYVGANPEETMARVLNADLETELVSVPEEWSRLLRRLLAPDPSQRFANAWELLRASSRQQGHSEPSSHAWDLPFSGRRRELARLRSALAETAKGRGVFFAVTGPPGVGKSALLDMVASEAAIAGLPCLRIEAPASQRPLALAEDLAQMYGNWQQALAEPAAQAASRLTAWPSALQEARDANDRTNANAHALANLKTLAGLAPHVVLIEDAHQLDPASCDLLQLAALRSRELGVLWIAAERETVATNGTASTQPTTCLQADHQGEAVQVLKLREFGLEEVLMLARRAFGPEHEVEKLAKRLFELTQGHPFFVCEAFQHLMREGALRRTSQGWGLGPNAERMLLPRVADKILAEHLGVLDTETQTVCRLLSLMPSGGQADTLARVLEASEKTVAEALLQAERTGLLRSTGTPPVSRFAHELLRETCAGLCPSSEARDLHLRIADALGGERAEAHHRLAAGETTRRSRDCYLREARLYETGHAPREALRFYEAALAIQTESTDSNEISLRVAELWLELGQNDKSASILEETRSRAQADDPLLLARCEHRLGNARARLGQRDAAIQSFRAAARLFQQHGDSSERTRFFTDWARTLLEQGDYGATLAECKLALQMHPTHADPEARSGLLLLRAQAERQSGDYEAAEATCRLALDAIKPLGRTRELARVYTQLGSNYLYRSEFEEAERFYRAALKVHTELADLHAMKGAHNNLGLALMRAGKLDEAIRAYEASLELRHRLGDRPGEGSSLNNLGNLWEKRGEHRKAFQCYRRGVTLYRRLDRPRELAILYNNMGEVHVRLGRYHKAARLLQQARRYTARLGRAYIAEVVAFNLGATLVGLGEHQKAIAILESALGDMGESGLVSIEGQFHGLLSLAYTKAGLSEKTQEHERRAAHCLTRDLEDETRLGILLDLAEAASQTGRLEDIESRAQEADTLADRIDWPYGKARALRLLATASQARGDWDLAESQLDQACEVCGRWGFQHELARCYKGLGNLHSEIGLRSRAENDLERSAVALERLGLEAELGLTYLQLARLVGREQAEADRDREPSPGMEGERP